MFRAVLYLRSSKDRSDVSIDAQRRALEEMAHDRQFLIVGEYADAVESGKDDDRPGFQSLLRDMRVAGRSWDHVLVLDTARVARRRAISIIFEEQECKKRGIRVVYKSLPESDPITEMLLKSILQAMDEWHSLTSRVKGLAGMAENVKQGWRAGGRAPRGYILQYTETGAVREGVAVTKSKLVPGDDALQVRAYLQHRAKGLPRSRAMQLAGVSWPASSLVDMERNALMYSGSTTWNRSAERHDGGYIGGEKVRPRSEWVIQKGTHEPLISDSEAESILATLDVRKRSGGQPEKRVYLLAGLLVSPDGKAWQGDSGAYRLGKGIRVQAESVDAAVRDAVISALGSDDLAESIANYYRQAAKKQDQPGEDPVKLKRRMVEIDRKTARLADLMTETTAQAALLRQIETLEEERESIAAQIDRIEGDESAKRTFADIRPADVRRFLRLLGDEMRQSHDPEADRDMVRQLVEKVELSAESFEARVFLRFTAPAKSGLLLASPRGAEEFPGFLVEAVVQIKHNRRRAL